MAVYEMNAVVGETLNVEEPCSAPASVKTRISIRVSNVTSTTVRCYIYMYWTHTTLGGTYAQIRSRTAKENGTTVFTDDNPITFTTYTNPVTIYDGYNYIPTFTIDEEKTIDLYATINAGVGEINQAITIKFIFPNNVFYNGTNITGVVYNNTQVNGVVYNGTRVM
jgi:hypothetical protein